MGSCSGCMAAVQAGGMKSTQVRTQAPIVQVDLRDCRFVGSVAIRCWGQQAAVVQHELCQVTTSQLILL